MRTVSPPPGLPRPLLSEEQAGCYTSTWVLDGWKPDSIHPDGEPDLVVDPAGPDTPRRFRSLQEAVDHILRQASTHRRITIGLVPGRHAGPVYLPKSLPPVTLLGMGPADSVELHANIDAEMPGQEYRERFESRLCNGPEAVKTVFDRIAAQATIGTGNTAVLRIESDDAWVSSLTIRNGYACDRDAAAPDGTARDTAGRYVDGQHQAVALMVAGADRVIIDGVHLSSYQDTLYLQATSARTPNHVHLRECDIEGDVDFIFGESIALFEHCCIRSRRHRGARSWVTAPSTHIGSHCGFVFRHCTFVHDNGKGMVGDMWLGRQWFQYVRATPYGVSHLDGYRVTSGEHSAWSPPVGTISRSTLEAVGKCVLLDCQLADHINSFSPWCDWNGGHYMPNGHWFSVEWNTRYRPVQTTAADFLLLLEPWLENQGLDYRNLDPADIWLGEYGSRNGSV